MATTEEAIILFLNAPVRAFTTAYPKMESTEEFGDYVKNAIVLVMSLKEVPEAGAAHQVLDTLEQARAAFTLMYPDEASSAEFVKLETVLGPYLRVMDRLVQGLPAAAAETVPLSAPYEVLVAVHPAMSPTLECQTFLVDGLMVVGAARNGTDPRTARRLLDNVEKDYLVLRQKFPVEVESPEFLTLGAVLLPHIRQLEEVAKQTPDPTPAEALAQLLDAAVRGNAGQAAGAPEVQVKRYREEKEYERDAQRMVAAGWRIEAQSSQRGNVKIGSTMLKAGVFLPWAMMRPSRKGDPITVTWLRGG